MYIFKLSLPASSDTRKVNHWRQKKKTSILIPMITNTYINNKMKLRRLIQGKSRRFETFQVNMVRDRARIEVQGIRERK